MSEQDQDYGFETLAIHAGAAPDPTTGARATPIYQTTSFVFDDVDHAASLFNLQRFGNIYSRITNPTVSVLEERIAALEGGTAACAVASGHAAQFIALLNLMTPGDEMISSTRLYGGSITQFSETFPKFDWHVRFVDPTKPKQFKKALKKRTKAIFIESASNPDGVIADLEAIAAIAHRGRHAADRRQHDAVALSLPAAASRRRHRDPLDDQVHRRPWQLDGRGDRRRRQLRLVSEATSSRR